MTWTPQGKRLIAGDGLLQVSRSNQNPGIIVVIAGADALMGEALAKIIIRAVGAAFGEGRLAHRDIFAKDRL